MKPIDKFINYVPQMEPVTFAGIANLLGVELMREGEPKDFADVLEQTLRKFKKLSKNKQLEIVRLVKYSLQERGINADDSEHTDQ